MDKKFMNDIEILLTVKKNGEKTSQNFSVGSNLLKSLYEMGFYEIANTCGGRGTCRRCLVDTDNFGEVISCQTRLDRNVTVYLKDKVASLERDNTLKIQSNVLQDISDVKENISRVTPDTNLGLAIDIGTTTIVIVLINKDTGDWLGEEKARNMQNGYGADVISRIDFSNKNGVDILSNVLQTQLNGMINNLLTSLGLDKMQIMVCSISGNTIMEHFLAGLSPKTIGVAPFNPLSYFGQTLSPSDVNLDLSPDSQIYIFPVIAGYVGGDITAGILSSGIYKSDKLSCLLDIGTNGEMVIGSAGKMIACATAAGPAFEGAEIEQGMLGIPGAIDMVSYHSQSDKPIKFTTIDDESPQGFCGSGLLDMLAVGVRSGLIQESGLLSDSDEVADNLRQYLAVVNDQNVILLDSENNIYLTQKDVRKLQSAKGAIAGGLKTILETSNIDSNDIEVFYLAGGFGSAINVNSLAEIGMIPETFANKTKVLGNASLSGSTMLVESQEYMNYINNIREICEYIELSTAANFTDNYIDSMFFTKF